MKKIHKVYLPKWQRWFLIPLFVLVWSMITYLKFFARPAGKDQLPTPVYIILTIIFLGIGIMMWLMTSGKLPAYMMEIDDDEQN